jgi:predicted DNA-binding protein YlxM (UPF0122 family)
MTPYADETLQLAFVAAGQLLPPRQRAVLLLRDVLDFSAAEVASMLATSPQAVNSALQRARARVAREQSAAPLAHPHEPASTDVERDLARRFAGAWQAADIDGIVALLTEDALLTMPPEPLRVVGRDAVGAFLAAGPFSDRRPFVTGDVRLNGQPCLALYRQVAASDLEPYGILGLAISGDRIASVTRFGDLRLFARLGC